ncbi:hypothetical protein LOTGIDRAFT_231800 [Lottia gigantea]|uniref:SKICH domain-containing protein n=1 Tax=Lottia gigantea TaxID=225164 RepID=V4AS22_LOTGI|nr:hypothetical protein LOTGIDRAFT_231800 [Lottia gigantea]ESO96511.1 hypothetical protein LOTGIDRAFT_231800 [Lottia gigantea]
MESWLNASDSEIEDVNTARDLVTFENIQKYYSPHSDIVAAYTIGDSYTTHKRDWIGLFQSGWEDFNKYVDFQWAKLKPFSQLLPMRRRVIFEAPHSKIENLLNTFQFLYISSGNQVVGVSDLFHILDLPQESDLNFDLLENALMDDEEVVIVPEPFSGSTDSPSKTHIDSSFYLPEVANTLDLDEHNTVLTLYSPSDRVNKTLAKTEMPFANVQNQKIVQFFNPEDSKDQHQPSWLQKIFTSAHPLVEMFRKDEETESDSNEKIKQKLKVTFQDTTSLIQQECEDHSWVDDLQIVEKENVVEDFYDFDHPFSQFASVFMNKSVEEPKDFIASSVVEEFKTRLSGSYEHLESVCSNEDWQDSADAWSNEYVEVFKQVKESNPPSSYDFSDDLDLDLLFHEKAAGKKNRKGEESRRPKRKNKKSRKNSRTIQQSEKQTHSSHGIDTTLSEPNSQVTVTVKSTKPSLRKRQRKSKTEIVEVPNKKADFSETSLALVPYKQPKPIIVSQPFLSSPIFFPSVPGFSHVLDIVPFSPKMLLSIPYQQRETEPIATQRRTCRVKFPYYTKKQHQSLVRSSRQNSGCISCKSNRKMVTTFKERCSTAEKQLGVFQKERADFQNQINLIREELRNIKSQKKTETASVATLTDRVEDLAIIVPEADDIIKNLNENNELLEMAFQSSLVDNAQLRHEMNSMQESLRTLNKQFRETASELRTTITEIEKKQSALESSPRCKCESSSLETIEKLKVIIERREQWIVSLLLRVDTQSHEVENKNKDLAALRELLENERQRANKAEDEREELKVKMASMVAKQSTSRVEDQPTWSGVVAKPETIKKARVQFTLCDETINQPTHSRIISSQPKPSIETSLSKSLEKCKSKAELWKRYNAELKKQIDEGLCRFCGMSFSPLVDKRIIEEHISYHKQFNHTF